MHGVPERRSQFNRRQNWKLPIGDGSDRRSVFPNPNPIPPDLNLALFSFNSLLSFRSPIWTYNYSFSIVVIFVIRCDALRMRTPACRGSVSEWMSAGHRRLITVMVLLLMRMMMMMMSRIRVQASTSVIMSLPTSPALCTAFMHGTAQ